MQPEATVLKANIQFEGRVLYDLLGGEVIESDSIALAEQIKNAKDANADNITIDLSKIEDDIIIIEDNGNGMSEDELIDHWFTIGTNNKTNQNDSLGGKGIGRLSLFRLASTILVETIKDNFKYSFTLNKEIIKEKGFSNINIYQETLSNQKSMTRITLNNLSKYIDLFEIEKGLENLNYPKQDKIHSIIFPNFFRENNYHFSESILEKAPFYAVATIEGGNIISYNFKCTVKEQLFYENDKVNNSFITSLEKELKKAHAADINLGEINIVLHNYFFDNPYLKWHGDINKDTINNFFLQAYQGISVYRNGYKVYGHGEEDWLKLAENRVSRAGANIDNKLTYGAVTLDSKKSLSLKEKTSREGFIKSPELSYFRSILFTIVKQMGQDREDSIKVIREQIKKEKTLLNQTQQKETETKEPNKDITKTKQPEDKQIDSELIVNPPLKKEIVIEETKTPLKKEAKNKKGNIYLDRNKIIDISYECSPNTPEKIKHIIEELKVINNRHVNAQSLLLRCLIDISTDYFQDTNSIQKTNHLAGNITNVLNYLHSNKLMNHNQIKRVRNSVKRTEVINYFNSVTHDYDYRPNFTDLKEVWNTFEIYITTCIN